ncbi:MAG: hypothetical protein CSA82_03110 [Actinobacteria bacterium]|nr:MAG: hypothetical protein CSA82_03110 [Actinomycetota bacterium]
MTNDEYREAQNRAAQCLTENGFTDVVYFPEEGGSSVADRTDISDEEEFQLTEKCEFDTGLAETESWYFLLRSNPDNVDWLSAERDCLVKAGLLEPGSTVEQMQQWWDSGHADTQSRQAYICSTDPLGHLGLK